LSFAGGAAIAGAANAKKAMQVDSTPRYSELRVGLADDLLTPADRRSLSRLLQRNNPDYFSRLVSRVTCRIGHVLSLGKENDSS
jgi:hypothetical protein